MIVAVLSDIHSNLRALEAVLGSLGTVDAVWHLGDVVGYGPEPDAVVERLREVGAVGVRGNHDDAACGGSSIEEFNPAARVAAEWTRDRITSATRTALRSLPERLVLDDFTLAHGSPRDPIFEYVFSPDVAADNLPAFETRYCLVGHTHVPLVFREWGSPSESTGVPRWARAYRVELLDPEPGATLRLDHRRALLNPGSVGQPRDGNPDASYLLLDIAAETVTWQRVPYDIAGTQAAMRVVGLPARLSSRLSFGE